MPVILNSCGSLFPVYLQPQLPPARLQSSSHLRLSPAFPHLRAIQRPLLLSPPPHLCLSCAIAQDLYPHILCGFPALLTSPVSKGSFGGVCLSTFDCRLGKLHSTLLSVGFSGPRNVLGRLRHTQMFMENRAEEREVPWLWCNLFYRKEREAREEFQQRELLVSPDKACMLVRGSRGRRGSVQLSRADRSLPPHLSQSPDWPLT